MTISLCLYRDSHIPVVSVRWRNEQYWKRCTKAKHKKQSLNFTQGNAVLLLSARLMVQPSVTCSHCISAKRQKLLACDKAPQSKWINPLTLYLLMWRIWWAPNNASKGQMGFNLAFRGLNAELNSICHLLALLRAHHIFHVSGLRVKSSQL